MGRKSSSETSGSAPQQAAVTAAPHFALPAECVVQQAQALREQMLPLVEAPVPVTVDVDELQRIDTAGIQILASFVEGRRREGLAVIWSGESQILERAADLLGLRTLLMLAESGE